LESDWRLNVALIGLSNWGINSAESGERIAYAAQLISPIPGPGFPLPYLIQLKIGGVYYYYATTGFVPGSVPWFSFAGFGAYPFDPPYPVYPDN